MKKIIALAVLFACSYSFAGNPVTVEWEKPEFGQSTNASVTWTFTKGTRGVLDNIWSCNFVRSNTNNITYTISFNGGLFTNVLPVVGQTNVSTARWTSSYLLEYGDTVKIAWSGAKDGFTNNYAIWVRDVTK